MAPASVQCSRCRECVDLSRPLPRQGWQVVHECRGCRIEALTMQPNGSPWAWRANEVEPDGAGAD